MTAQVGTINTLSLAPSGDKSPDSLTTVGNTLFAEYGNGADSTGVGGSSQIVQYDSAGNVLHTYTVAGSVDGLKYNPYNHAVYALQNQDGNSTLTLIDPRTHQVSAPITYANPSAAQGYDDIVFKGNKTFLSYTNPSVGTDPTVVELSSGNSPFSPLKTTPILTMGSTGTNTVTGQRNQPLPITDPDSLKSAPNGDLLFSGAADGVIADIHNPGKADQSVKFTQITDRSGNPASNLDDVIKPGATSGTFVLTDTAGNQILSVHMDNLNPNDYYASVESLGGFGQVDPKTGVFKLLVAAPGAHGVAFQPSAQPTAGGGDHHFVYNPGFAQNDIANFALSGANHDTVSFASSEFSSLAQVLHDTTMAGGNAVIHDPNGLTLTLGNVTKAEIKANPSDFKFHA